MLKIILLFALGVASLQGAPAPPSRSNTVPQVKLEKFDLESTNRILLLKFKASATPEQVRNATIAFNLKDATKGKRLKWKQYVVPPGQAKRDHISILKSWGTFEHIIEPKTYTTQETVPNDPMFPSLWGMTNIVATLAWDRIKDAPDVVVAVVDTGIDFTHPDLVDNLWTGQQGEHGYVATNGVVLPGGLDDHGHGTHVAGTIGAVGNNGVGVVGVAWKTKIMAMKVLHRGSGSSLDIVNGYEKLVELKENGVPVLVSNHSYGGRGADPFMEDGFRMLADADIFAAVAAGNDNSDLDIVAFQPASFSFDNMVVALATDSTGNKASFSNFGLVGSDISAPGVAVLSTTRSNTYSSFSGTSMASPHVAGLATLVRQLNRNLTAPQTREVILHPSSYDAGDYFSSTSGKINAAKTVNNPKVFEQPFISNGDPNFESIPIHTLVTTKPTAIPFIGIDPDGDALRWNAAMNGNTLAEGLSLFFERHMLGLGDFSLTTISNKAVVSGGPYAYQFASTLSVAMSDQRGSGKTTNVGFEFVRIFELRKPIPLKTWTVTTNSESATRMTFTLDVDDPAKTNYLYGLLFNYPDGSLFTRWFYEPSSTPFVFYVNRPDFSVRAFIIDKWFNYLNTDVISYPQASSTRPKCIVTVSTNEGNAPFDVVFDLSKSERAVSWAVPDLFDSLSTTPNPIHTVPFATHGFYLKMPLVKGAVLGEIDLTVVPVFASRFLDAAPPSRTANLTIYKAPAVTGPWAAFTNFTDTITGPEQFYRLEAR